MHQTTSRPVSAGSSPSACVQTAAELASLTSRTALGISHPIGTHDDSPVEDAPRVLVQDPVEVLVALAVRLGVIDRGVVVGVLAAVQDVEPVQQRQSVQGIWLKDHAFRPFVPCIDEQKPLLNRLDNSMHLFTFDTYN